MYVPKHVTYQCETETFVSRKEGDFSSVMNTF